MTGVGVVLAAEIAHHRQDARHLDPRLQGALAGGLDDRTVRHRVGESACRSRSGRRQRRHAAQQCHRGGTVRIPRLQEWISAPRPSLFNAANRVGDAAHVGDPGCGVERKQGQGALPLGTPPGATGPWTPNPFFVEGGGRGTGPHAPPQPAPPQRKNRIGMQGPMALPGGPGGQRPPGLASFLPHPGSPPSELHPQVVGDGEDVLIAAAAEVHDDDLVLAQGGGELGDVGQSVGRFEGGMMPSVRVQSWKAASASCRWQRRIRRGRCRAARNVPDQCSGVVQAGADAVGLDDLPVVVLQQVGCGCRAARRGGLR